MSESVEAFERERRFLVKDSQVVNGAPWEEIVQAYVFAMDGYAVRIRLVSEPGKVGHQRAWLTGKGPRIDDLREEYDQEVSPIWASAIIARSANVVRKRRYQLVTDQTWEVDEFLDENKGLWIAELEGGPDIRWVPLPSWADHEIRNDPRYNNEDLALRPFSSW